MALSKKPVNGMKDILPEEMQIRDYVQQVIKETYRNFGFTQIETPCMENIANLSSKQGGENEKLIFKVMKRGEKLKIAEAKDETDLVDFGMRYDLTVPLVRYYSNIVGKYGSPVQKALQKLGGLPISAICSTHGPVWTENITKVVGIYDKLSRYDADEGVVIAYGSMYGNTEQMAEAIAAELSAQGIKNIVMHNVSKSNPSYILADIFRYKGLIIGSPTYSNQIFPEVESLLSKILVRELKGRYLGYFGSFTWAGAAVKRMAEFAEKSKFELVGDPVEMKQAMKEITYQQCENLARAMAGRLKKDRV